MEDVLITIGDNIKKKRLERELEIEDLANRLRIKTTYLRAIESGKIYQHLPKVYSNGYIRTYADSLGLNGKDIVSSITEQITQDLEELASKEPKTVIPRNVASNKKSKLVYLLLSLLILQICFWSYKYYHSQQNATNTQILEEEPNTTFESSTLAFPKELKEPLSYTISHF